jgi:glycosyltransferase involved in cell wall biosynthesis
MSKFSNKLLDVFSNNQFNHNIWDALQQDYPTEEILAQIADEIYNKKSLQMDRVVHDLKNIPTFKTRKETVKTVGTFYFRLFNGGVEKVISLVVDIWIKQGYKVVLFTDAQPSDDDYILPDEVQRVIVPSLGKDPTREKFLIRARAWKELIAQYNIDLMVYHAWLNGYFAFDEIALKSTGIPLVVQIHGTSSTGLTCINSNEAYMTTTQENTYSMCDTIVTLSSVDNVWWSLLGLPCKKIYNPPPYILEEVSVAPLDSKIVLWVGRLSQEKQIYEALKAIKIVHETVPDVQLWILGKGETEQDTIEVKTYLDENGMSDYVILKGFQSCVKPFYQQAALTLMTSQFEGFPMVAIESALSGVPLVIYELPNLELVRKSTGVTVAPQGDFNALAKRMIELLQNGSLRKVKGQTIRNDAMQMYSKDLGEKWNEIFEFSLTEKPPHLPKYQRDEAAVAVIIAMQHLRTNFINSHKVNLEKDEWIAHLERDIATLNNDILHIFNDLEETREECRKLKEQNQQGDHCKLQRKFFIIKIANRIKNIKIFNMFKRSSNG